MSHTKAAPIIIASSLLIIISTISTANAQNLLSQDSLRDTLGVHCVSLISGLVQCGFPPLSPPNESPLPEEINVVVGCNGHRAVITKFIGDPNGFFEVLAEFLTNPLSDPNGSNRDCRIAVRFNSGVCGVFPAEFVAEMTPVGSATPQLVSQDCPFERFIAGEFQQVDGRHY